MNWSLRFSCSCFFGGFFLVRFGGFLVSHSTKNQEGMAFSRKNTPWQNNVELVKVFTTGGKEGGHGEKGGGESKRGFFVSKYF